MRHDKISDSACAAFPIQHIYFHSLSSLSRERNYCLLYCKHVLIDFESFICN